MNFLRLITERMRSVNSHFITEIMRSERLSLVGLDGQFDHSRSQEPDLYCALLLPI